MRGAWYGIMFGFVVLSASAFGGRAASLLGDGIAGGGTSPLVSISVPGNAAQGGSLFAGRDVRGLFAPPAELPPAISEQALSRLLPGRGGAIAALRDLIAKAEAGPAGYNAVVWNARIRPPRPPSNMTLQEIFDWIAATPGQNHAIGRYQFIPKTLRNLVAEAGLPSRTRFSPDIQDRLADMLLVEAGLQDFLDGRLSRKAFMQNLARIWAGLPMPSGKSFYHGVAGNKATMTWVRFDTEMARIFPG